MKQEMISYLSTIDNELSSLCRYLYDNPEESYHETLACNYLQNLLLKHDFIVEKNFLNISNSFFASKGNGYPKICYLCEYDAIKDKGHITGHNALTTISIGAALTLANSIKESNGTVIVIGCPGEYLGGTKGIMTKQGVFDDIDLVMVCHPHTTTSESGSSYSIIPLSITFKGNSGLSFLNKNSYTSLDAILLTFNILNSLSKSFPKDVELNSILSRGGYTPLLIPLESEAKFYIRAKEYALAEVVNNKLREIANCVSTLTNIKHTTSLYEPPSENLKTNKTLNRLFMHNLKESGIIDISGVKDISAGLSIGSVSQKVPCIHPYISLVEDSSIKYGTQAFADATITDFAFSQMKKSSLALALTALDLIENNLLLKEVKEDFFNN